MHVNEARELRTQYPHRLGTAHFLLLGVAEVQSVVLRDGQVAIELGDQIAKILPLKVTEIDAASVLDLRLPDAQRWFTEYFGGLEVESGRRNDHGIRTIKETPESLRDILPTLVTPTPGGTTFHQAVGAWLRANGVFGLVFPSARRNGSLHVTTDGVVLTGGTSFCTTTALKSITTISSAFK